MVQIVVGSTAAKNYFPEFREGKDLDAWCDSSDFPKIESDKRVEFKDVSPYPNLLDFLYEAVSLRDKYCDPSLLYTLKLSHSFWGIHWEKTAHDIRFFQSKGLKHNDYYLQAMRLDWTKIHGKKRAYLNKSNEAFFADNVKRTYEHDDVHKVMAYYKDPLYMSCKKDQSKALFDKELYENLSHEDKIKLVREEATVTALERFLIPDNFKMPAEIAYRKALKQLVTSMCKGKFAESIMLNLTELWTLDREYDTIFRENSHRCRKINECKRD